MKNVFFTGHRAIGAENNMPAKLAELLCRMISEGATDFYAGGALGWDMLCEKAVLRLREKYFPNIKLHLILPCPPAEQTARWNFADREEYLKIYEAADSVEIIAEHYNRDCMKKRNARLAELGDVCVCFYNEGSFRSGTAQTVRMAERLGKKIINILEL